NLSKAVSLQELCRTFGISQTYMSRLFRKYSGNSYSQYLTELRMNRAKELFQENPDSFIKDVAATVGYEDQFYFSRIFRSYTGKSPSEYLKECGE
ncbi:MAG: helix-turn-helix transcriptional regulator, partial [Blautia sp.]|nr:helix-turn-helix transcriptional regulator [Blautia sp.]